MRRRKRRSEDQEGEKEDMRRWRRRRIGADGGDGGGAGQLEANEIGTFQGKTTLGKADGTSEDVTTIDGRQTRLTRQTPIAELASRRKEG